MPVILYWTIEKGNNYLKRDVPKMEIWKIIRCVFLCIFLIVIIQASTNESFRRDYSKTTTVPFVGTGRNVEYDELNGTISTASDFDLPPSWEEFCVLQEKENNKTVYNYKCYINGSSSGQWNFTELRRYIFSTSRKYSFDVHCQSGSKISLPFPAKAKNIIKLHVRDCIAVDYFADFKNLDLDSIPDELEEYKTINVQRLVGMKEIMDNMQIKSESLQKNLICGDEDTLKVIIERNTTFTFIIDIPKFDVKIFSIIATGNVLDKRLSPHTCVYKKLKVLENSFSTLKPRNFAAILTELNQYSVLKILNISHSYMRFIPSQFKNWWYYFEQLEYLDISFNRVQDFSFPIDNLGLWGQPVPVLTLDLTFNNISRISVRSFEGIIQNKKCFINIAHNPFNCTCTDEMKELLKYIQETDWNSPKYQNYQYLRDLECQYPGYVKGRRLRDLTPQDINCKFELMPITVALSVFSFFLIIFVVVILKYRREIRILFFTRFNIILPCQANDMFEEKEFDAFISYSNDDQEWVCNTFDEKKHERLAHLKFCMHHKDFVPGKTIFENIIKCIENSRHTVIVLSRNFLDSHFCLWEFQEAFQQSIVERKRHLIIILLEDIPDKDLPNELKRCMKTFTYIRKDDKICIDRLLYALSYKGKLLDNRQKVWVNEGFNDLDNPKNERV